MTQKEWKEKLKNERIYWMDRLNKERELRYTIEDKYDKGVKQLREASDAVLAAVIKKYGTEDTIIIPKPEMGAKLKTEKTESGYVITLE